MNADEAHILTRMIVGYWPSPAMSADEVDVWIKHLAPLDFEDASDVIEMVATAGRQFRPGAGEFVAEYRQKTARPAGFPAQRSDGSTAELEAPRNACGHSPNVVACKESVRYWVDRCKRQLAEARGPLFVSFPTPQASEEAF